MNTNDLLISDARCLLAASKNREYRKRVEQHFRVFVSFLQDNKLATRTILADSQPVPENLQIWKSDLTEQGFAVVKAGYDKWLRAHDKGTAITDVTILEKVLAQVRAG